LNWRHIVAANLVHGDAWGDPLVPRAAEALLVYAPWRSSAQADHYAKAIEDGRAPAPPVTKLERLEDLDRLRRLTPEAREAILAETEKAVNRMEQLRKEARNGRATEG
jgi:hypothetical protein